MNKRTYLMLSLAMVAVAVAVRLNNAVQFPPLRGYDGFGHFTYIWYLAETGRIPLATEGWSFFHPPLYYWLMAAIWKALPTIDPMVRLELGTAVMSLLSLSHAAVAYVIVRRVVPTLPVVHLLVLGLMLFLPVHLYSASFLGNEGLSGALCSLSLLALLAVLRRATWKRAVLLGLLLGMAILTKFSAGAVVAGALTTLMLWTIRRARTAAATGAGASEAVRREIVAGARTLGVVGAVMLVVCGWYYARNMELYGTPFKLSRGEFMVRLVEENQPQARRTLLEYVVFDPVVLRRPQWPRGPIMRDDSPYDTMRSVRDSVWTGVYANTWFDGFGGWVLPPVTESELARRSGQALLCLGLVPTALMLLGFVSACARLRRQGWDGTIVAMLTTFAIMIAVFISHTFKVPIPASVKATYFIPISAIFGFWFALGLERLARWRPRWLNAVALESAVLGGLSVIVFSQGLLFDVSDIYASLPNYTSALRNQRAIVYYAAGDRSRAREIFEVSAADDWHLAYENLAYLAADEGEAEEALALLSKADGLLEEQAFGTPEGRRQYVATTRAELRNSTAVFLHAAGRDDEALPVANEAVALDASIPAAHYNAGVLELIAALRAREIAEAEGAVHIDRAEARLRRSIELDEGLVEGHAMLGVAVAIAGRCDEALAKLSWALAPHPELHRKYPVETGTGAGFFAAVARRRLIDVLPEDLDPHHWLRRCDASARAE